MQRLRFLHIPKTAGSTFAAILRRQYAGEKVFEFSGGLDFDRKEFCKLSDQDRNGVSLFMGHAPFITGLAQADSATTITFLREPISRVRSFCQYVSEGKVSYLVDRFPPESFSLDALLECGTEEISNLQTKMLITNDSWPSQELMRGMSDSDARDNALDNLFNKIAHFGLQEYFDESLVIFASELGWKAPYYASLNRKNSRKPLEFETRHLDRIAELNAVDREVYARAKERFTGLLSGETFSRARLIRFRLVNRLYQSVTHISERSNNIARRIIGN